MEIAPVKLKANPVNTSGVAFASSKNAKPMYDKPTSLIIPAILIAMGPQIVTVNIDDKVIKMPEKPLNKTREARLGLRVVGFSKTSYSVMISPSL